MPSAGPGSLLEVKQPEMRSQRGAAWSQAEVAGGTWRLQSVPALALSPLRAEPGDEDSLLPGSASGCAGRPRLVTLGGVMSLLGVTGVPCRLGELGPVVRGSA